MGADGVHAWLRAPLDRPHQCAALPALACPCRCAADRKLRMPRPKGSAITCADFRSETVFGFVLLAGTETGHVVLYDVTTLK
jgi:hypothetical protein